MYSTRCLPAIEAQIAGKDYKVAHLFGKVDARVFRFGPDHNLYAEHMLFNINTPEDFEKAGELVKMKLYHN